jgi:hypothetical protein
LLRSKSINPAEMAELAISKGTVLGVLGRYTEALKLITNAIDIAKELKVQTSEMEGHFALSEVFELSGNTGEALVQYLLGLQIKELVNRQKANSYLADIGARHKSERDAFQIRLLSKEAQLQDMRLKNMKTYFSGLTGLILMIALTFVIFTRFNRLKTEHRSALLRQRLMNIQLNPRLVFDALNDIGNYVSNEETDKAVSFLSYFSRFIHIVLHGAQKDIITLDNEIMLANCYLNIQTLSHPGCFIFNVHIPVKPDPGELTVPPFLVFPFVERAVRKVINSRSGDGYITINYTIQDSTLIAVVEDNGDNSAGNQDIDDSPRLLTERAIELTKERLDFLGKKVRDKLGIETIFQPEEPGKPAVNYVRIVIPVYKI